MSHQGFETAAEALDFIFSGKAVVTLTSAKSGAHFTFKIKKGKDEGAPFFVQHLFGSDNSWNGDWGFLGTVFCATDGTRSLVGGRKGYRRGAPPFKAFKWTLDQLRNNGAIPDDLTIQHNDACGRCGRELTDPVSVATGLGPVCRGR